MPEIKVLLVDDEPDYAETMAFWLKAKGYQVEIAENGMKALASLKSCCPDIVFLDVMMPVMDGIETLKSLRKMHPYLPVIMVSAFGSKEAVEEANRLGAVGFFPKGGDLSEAAVLIRQALEKVMKGDPR